MRFLSTRHKLISMKSLSKRAEDLTFEQMRELVSTPLPLEDPPEIDSQEETQDVPPPSFQEENPTVPGKGSLPGFDPKKQRPIVLSPPKVEPILVPVLEVIEGLDPDEFSGAEGGSTQKE